MAWRTGGIFHGLVGDANPRGGFGNVPVVLASIELPTKPVAALLASVADCGGVLVSASPTLPH